MWESGEVLEVGVFFLACVCHEVNQNSFGKPLSFPHPSVRHTGVFSYCMSATIMFLIHFYFRMWNSSFLGGEGKGVVVVVLKSLSNDLQRLFYLVLPETCT